MAPLLASTLRPMTRHLSHNRGIPKGRGIPESRRIKNGAHCGIPHVTNGNPLFRVVTTIKERTVLVFYKKRRQQRFVKFVSNSTSESNSAERKADVQPSNATVLNTGARFSVYVDDNFSVRYQNWCEFVHLVTDASANGVIRTEFQPIRLLRSMNLSADANKIKSVPNAGGNSVLSEVMSFELLHTCFGASLLKTEMEVSYFPSGGSITDYVCRMFDLDLGVSVTRAMKYHGDFDADDAQKLLHKKLFGVKQSTHNSMDKWSKQILHIWATSTAVADTVMTSFRCLGAEVRSNTVVLVTVAEDCGFIFDNT